MDQNGVKSHKLIKKERGQYPAILIEQAWSIKDLLYGFRGIFLAELSGSRGKYNISHVFAALAREILFLPLEHKIHVFSPLFNVFILSDETGHLSVPTMVVMDKLTVFSLYSLGNGGKEIPSSSR